MTTTKEKFLSERVKDKAGANLNDLECSICHDLVWKPIACTNCDAFFCSDNSLAKNPELCHDKEKRCSSFAERKCPTFITRQLARLQLTCVNLPNGCEKVKYSLKRSSTPSIGGVISFRSLDTKPLRSTKQNVTIICHSVAAAIQKY